MVDVRFDSAVAEFDEATGFRMLIPDTDSFQHGDINANQEDIDEAEKKSRIYLFEKSFYGHT